MNNPKPNYFYVNRALLNSDRWLSEPFTRGQAWVDLFGLAQHCNSFFRVRGIKIDVKRGQLAYSQKTLALRWKWSRNKIIRYLKELENQGDIEQQNNNITTLITIVKYDLWQGNGTPDGTPERHQKDTRRDTYNNDKNDNKEEYNDFTKSKIPLKDKKKDMKYNPNNFEDDYEKKIDANTGEEIKPEIKKAEGRNKIALRLQDEFVKMAEKEIGHKPIYSKAGYVLLCRALKVMSEKDILDSFTDWFNESKKEEDLIQITQALSNNRLNRWRVNK